MRSPTWSESLWPPSQTIGPRPHPSTAPPQRGVVDPRGGGGLAEGGQNDRLQADHIGGGAELPRRPVRPGSAGGRRGMAGGDPAGFPWLMRRCSFRLQRGRYADSSLSNTRKAQGPCGLGDHTLFARSCPRQDSLAPCSEGDNALRLKTFPSAPFALRPVDVAVSLTVPAALPAMPCWTATR